MTSEITVRESEVNEDGTVTVPSDIRHRLGVEDGDRLRWTVDDEGALTVEVVCERYGAFEGAQAAPLGDDSLDSYDAG